MIPKKTVIAFLIFLAVFLTCVLALQQFNLLDSRVQADHSGRAGRYVVATTLFDETRSLFWVANVDNQTLSVYSFLDSGGFALVGIVNLNMIFRPIMPTYDPRLTPQQQRNMQNQQTNPNIQIRPPSRDPNRIRI